MLFSEIALVPDIPSKLYHQHGGEVKEESAQQTKSWDIKGLPASFQAFQVEFLVYFTRI